MELRVGPRLAVSMPVLLRFPEGDGGEGWGRVTDMSVGGVKLETRWPLRAGMSLYVTFAPQGDLRLENLRARVVRVSWDEGYYSGGLAFDPAVDKNLLREAMMIMMAGEA